MLQTSLWPKCHRVITKVRPFRQFFFFFSFLNQQHKSPSVHVRGGVQGGRVGVALHRARINSAIWMDNRMFLTYHPEYSPLILKKKKKNNSSEMFTNTVLKGFEIHCCTLPTWPDISPRRHWELQYHQTAKIGQGSKNGEKRWHLNGWNASDFLQKVHIPHNLTSKCIQC